MVVEIPGALHHDCIYVSIGNIEFWLDYFKEKHCVDLSNMVLSFPNLVHVITLNGATILDCPLRLTPKTQTVI